MRACVRDAFPDIEEPDRTRLAAADALAMLLGGRPAGSAGKSMAMERRP
jgi:hypothetical protein